MKCRLWKRVRAREQAKKMGWDERKWIQHNVRGTCKRDTWPERQGEGGIGSVSLGEIKQGF